MGILKKIDRKYGDGNFNRQVSYQVSVTVDGYFTTTLDPSDAEFLKSHGVRVNLNKMKRAGFYSARTLDSLVEKIENDFKFCFSEKIIEEKIMLEYQLSTSIAYCRTEQGEIVPNGEWVKGFGQYDDYKSGSKAPAWKNWYSGTETIHLAKRKPGTVQFFISPVKYLKYEYKNGETRDEYLHLSERQVDKNKCPNLYYLASIKCMNKASAPLIRIDYTEDVAGFFVNVFKGMAELIEKINQFSEPEMIKAAAISGDFKNLLS
jgi:hypothetical protein